jgi:hypothetical protein
LLELDDADLEPIDLDGLDVPVYRMTSGGLPGALLTLGGVQYHYDSSYPIKGYAAILPRYLAEQLSAGKKPLLIERANPSRYYLYLSP